MPNVQKRNAALQRNAAATLSHDTAKSSQKSNPKSTLKESNALSKVCISAALNLDWRKEYFKLKSEYDDLERKYIHALEKYAALLRENIDRMDDQINEE